MDEIVLQAMARWPNVPAVYGWLRLDRRGRWLIKGDAVANPIANAFIGRNYLCDSAGRWYFQNGPQQVFVELEYTPYIYRVWRNAEGQLAAETHNGLVLNHPSRCWLDDTGGVLIEDQRRIGCVEGHSLVALAGALCDVAGTPLPDQVIEALLEGDQTVAAQARLLWNGALLPVGLIRSTEVPGRFGFDPTPQPPPESPPGQRVQFRNGVK